MDLLGYRHDRQVGMIRRYYEPAGGTPPARPVDTARKGRPTLTTDRLPMTPNARSHPRFPAILAAALLGLLALTGCVYVAPIAQGNLLKQDDVDQVEVGMTKNQVRFLLGTPMVDDPFHQDRWDYVYYLKIGRRDAAFKRWISIHFAEERVAEIVADQVLSSDL